MPDYEVRFILNPTEIVWFRLFLCVMTRQRGRETEGFQGVCVVSSIVSNSPIFNSGCAKYGN